MGNVIAEKQTNNFQHYLQTLPLQRMGNVLARKTNQQLLTLLTNTHAPTDGFQYSPEEFIKIFITDTNTPGAEGRAMLISHFIEEKLVPVKKNDLPTTQKFQKRKSDSE